MLGIIFAVAVGVTLGMLLTIVVTFGLMTNETVIKWYCKYVEKMAKVISKTTIENEKEN